MEDEFGLRCAERYWTIFNAFWMELGYVDYLGALQCYRRELEFERVDDQRLPGNVTLLFSRERYIAAADAYLLGGVTEEVVQAFRREGVDVEAIAARLQREGADACSTSWSALLTRMGQKRAQRTP